MNNTINSGLNSGINSGLNNLLGELNAKNQRLANQTNSLNTDKTLAELAELADANPEQSQQLETAVAKIINRLLEGLRMQKGTAVLSEQAKNTPLSKNIAKDLSELISQASSKPALKELAAKLESLINPKNGAELERSLANSGVFYESRLRAALNKEVLPKSFFRLINFMKNLRSSELKAQIFALGDENMDAKASLAALNGFIKKELAKKNLPQSKQSNSEQTTKDAKNAPDSKIAKNQAQAIAQKALKSTQAKANKLDDKQVLKFLKTLDNASKYLAKTPQKAPMISRAIQKQLDNVLLKLLEAAPNEKAPIKLANLKAELIKHFKPSKSTLIAAAQKADIAHLTNLIKDAKQAKMANNLNNLLQQNEPERALNNANLEAKQIINTANLSSERANLADEVAKNLTQAGAQVEAQVEADNADNAPKNAQANNAANTKANESLNQSSNQSSSAAANQATNQPINQATNQATNQPTNQPANQPTNQSTNSAINLPEPALPPHIAASIKPNIQGAFLKASIILARAEDATKGTALKQAATLLDNAINSENAAPARGVNELANKLKAASNMLHSALKGAPNYEKQQVVDELKALKNLLNQAASDEPRLRNANDLKALENDAKALLLKTSEAANNLKDGEHIAKLANKALAQIELNQLISASNAEIFTHLPFDFANLEHASVGIKSEGDDKFSAAIKLDFKYLGKINVMLALEGEKYLQLNVMVENEAFKEVLINGAAEFKRALRKAGLIVGGFFISQLKRNVYENDDHLEIGLDLRI